MYYEDFDNISKADFKKLWGNGKRDYYTAIIPEWTLPYFVNYDLEGYTEEELTKMRNYVEKFANLGIYDVGQYFVPTDDATPYFSVYNDIDNKGADCYYFLIPNTQNEIRNKLNKGE